MAINELTEVDDMSHRSARLFKPLLRIMGRSSQGARPSAVSAAVDRPCRCLDSSYTESPYANGPTIHHTGYRPPMASATVALFGIGMGSVGMHAAGTEVTK
ncbi:hypothetical protein [Streptomyces sp. NPDC001851]|uniref:hypothetical protein n=1 Tax=Streptomyces sp. NPDC001851 TaxID=3154529 RepID=UPI003324DF04